MSSHTSVRAPVDGGRGEGRLESSELPFILNKLLTRPLRHGMVRRPLCNFEEESRMATPRRRRFSSLSGLAIAAAIIALAAHAQATVPPCGSTSAPLCDGECAIGETCFDAGGTCVCITTGMACGTLLGAPICTGECAPGEACIDMAGTCVCSAAGPPPACGGASTSACDGSCGIGQSCVDIGGGSCGCIASGLMCGFAMGAPACQGQCAPGTACMDIAGTCVCTMPPPVPLLSPLGGSVLAALAALLLGLPVRRRRD